MAWQVLVDQNNVVKVASGWQLHIRAKYYEDTDPSNTPTPTVFMWQKDFYFDGDTLTLVVVRDAVFAEGAKQRLAYTNANTGVSLPALAVGSIYPVP